MAKLILFAHITLDGVIQGPGGPDEDTSGGFTHGGWSRAVGLGDLDDDVTAACTSDHDLVLGRKTYDIWANYWPKISNDNPIARQFNKATKYVASRSERELSWKNSIWLDGDVVNQIGKLKTTNPRDLHIWGSSDLLQTLLAADLLDELHLWTYPIVLGRGKRLFGPDLSPFRYRDIRTRTTPSGIVMTSYTNREPLSDNLAPRIHPTATETA